jgi:hypothetical protein
MYTHSIIKLSALELRVVSVRYKLNSYLLFRWNSCLRGLIFSTILPAISFWIPFTSCYLTTWYTAVQSFHYMMLCKHGRNSPTKPYRVARNCKPFFPTVTMNNEYLSSLPNNIMIILTLTLQYHPLYEVWTWTLSHTISLHVWYQPIQLHICSFISSTILLIAWK